jgi:hypothetical protein
MHKTLYVYHSVMEIVKCDRVRSTVTCMSCSEWVRHTRLDLILVVCGGCLFVSIGGVVFCEGLGGKAVYLDPAVETPSCRIQAIYAIDTTGMVGLLHIQTPSVSPYVDFCPQ